MNGKTLGAALVLAVVVALAGGCKDEIAPPTQGFIGVDAGDVADADVFLDDVFQGTGVTELGPMEAGPHRVRVERACYGNLDDAEKTVEVVPAEITHASWALDPQAFGQISFAAADEFDGTAVAARIQRETAPDVWTDTGQITPATLTVPCGTFRYRLASPDPARYADSAPVAATIEEDTGQLDLVLPMRVPRAVLGEMFTYFTCAGCPNAAAELSEMHVDNPGRFFLVEWHSQLPLPLSDPRWRAREQFYVTYNPPKPAVAHQGGYLDDPVLLIGSEAAQRAEYHERFGRYLASCANDCPLALRVEAANRLQPKVRVLWRGGSLPSPLRLHVVLIEHHVESGGNQPWFDFVARDLYEADLTFSNVGEVLDFPASFSLGAGWDPDQLNVVAFVQEMTGTGRGEILATAGTANPLPEHP